MLLPALGGQAWVLPHPAVCMVCPALCTCVHVCCRNLDLRGNSLIGGFPNVVSGLPVLQ
jgi:hypothetical protein